MLGRAIAGALLALFVLGSSACGGQEAEGSVVVGLTTDVAVGFDLDRVEIVTRVDGAVARAESLSYDAGKLSLPAALPAVVAPDGAELEVSAAAFRGGGATPLVTRRAVTRAVGGTRALLPLSLDEACFGQSCPASETCVNGACAAPFLPPSALPDDDPAWLESAPDACKPSTPSEAKVVIGQGQEAFAPLDADEVVALEPGPQGGHHLWLALRVAGLRQMGSTLTVGGTFPDLAFTLPPAIWSVTLRRAGGGQCEVFGVRFQVDRGIPVEMVRGHALEVTATLEDPTGDAATAQAHVVLAP